jgi:hypothetical protein
MGASYKGHARVVELFLAVGAEKNLKDKVSPPLTPRKTTKEPPSLLVHSHPQEGAAYALQALA